MNEAYRTALLWLLSQIDISRGESETILETIAAGLLKREADSQAIFVRMVEQAEVRAMADPDGGDVLALIQMGHQLAVAQDILGRTETMLEMRRIDELPAVNSLAQRIRKAKLDELKATLGIEVTL